LMVGWIDCVNWMDVKNHFNFFSIMFFVKLMLQNT